MNYFYKQTNIFITLFIFSMMFTSLSYSQVANYQFSQIAGTYTEITGGTVLYSGTFDDGLSTPISIPPFLYDGNTYTSLTINANGHIAFGTYTSTTNYTPLSGTTNATGGIVAGFGRDLNNAASGAPEIRYELIGNEFIVQYKDVRRYNVTGETISFQIKLNTSTNVISIVYGGSITPGSNATYPQIGLKGPNNTFATNINNRTIAVSGGAWINSTAGTTNASTMYFNSADLTTIPSSGLTYTFTPPNFPPSISYTALLNTTSTSNRNLNDVIITDLDGVNGTSGTAPRIYFKKSSDANVFGGNTSGDNGWKWTESTGASPFNFTIDYSIINGGSVALADTIQYFVVAQDLAGTPAVGSNPSTGFVGTSVSTITSAPTTPNKYIITATALSGDYTVGLTLFNKITGNNIYFEKSISKVLKEVWVENQNTERKNESLETPILPEGKFELREIEEVTYLPIENGITFTGDLFFKKADHPEYNFPDGVEGVYATITAAVADLNLRGVSGPTSFLLVDTLYSTETLPIIINVSNINVPNSTNTITIKPNTGVVSKISGASTSSQVFRILSSYVTIDGSNSASTTRNLTIENTSITSPQVILIGSLGSASRMNVTIKNCNLINGINTSSALVVSDGTAAGTAGWFRNITIQNNTIQKAYIGAYCNAVVSPGNGSGLFLLQNDLSATGTNALRFVGLYIQGVDSAIVSQNTIANFDGVSGEDDRGIWFATATRNTTIERNRIHSLKYIGTGGYGAHGITVSTGTLDANITIKNNMISDISGDAWGTSILADNPFGIYIFSVQTGVKVYYNSINLFGNTLNRANAISAGIVLGTGSTAEIKNNIVVNNLGALTTLGLSTIGVYLQTDSTQLVASDFNDIYVNPTGTITKFIGQIAANGQSTLGGWQTATGTDLNSISDSVTFTADNDLHIPNGTVTALESAGTPIVGITTDIDGQTRNASTPDIGADEFAGVNPADVLAGDYYIPQGSNPQGFNTLADAIAALNTFGVSSAVRFLIDDNLNEVGANLLITRSDLTESNNLIIKPAPTKTPSITITGCASTSGASQYSGISYSGASYITIDGSNTDGGTTRDLTLAMNDSLNGRIGMTLYGNTDFLVIKNLNIIFQKIIILNSSTRGIYANGQASGVADSLVIENCKIGDDTFAPAYSVSITGSSGSSFYASKVYIKNNELRGVLRSVYFFYGGLTGTTSEISGNTINPTYAPVTGNVVWGMLFNTYGGTVNIYDNKMYHLISASTSTNGVYGIGTLTSQAGTVVNIYNNFLGGDFQHTGTGVPASVDVISFQDNIPQANVFYNTIVLNNINKPTAPRLTGIRWGGTANVNLKNNIVINENDVATAYALYSAGGTFASDYNDLYVSGSNANIGFSGIARQSFQTWQDSTGQDANSVNVAAPFTAALDFHIPDGTLTPLESAGTPIALVTTDIDGQPRNLSNPDIGADEFAGLLLINAPSNLTAVADTFAVLLSWTDNSTNELGFYIERKNGDTLSVDPFVVIDTVGVDTVNYNDLGRTPNTTYTYRVQAFNLLGVSSYSNEVTTTTIIPVELTSFAANVTEQEISILWSTATELNNRGFDLERKLDGTWEKVAFIEGRGTTTEKSDYSYSDKFKYDGYQGTVQYRLKQIDFDGTITYSNVISVDVDFTPKEYTLFQNYPNPFNPSTTIKFALPFDSNVRITIYNMLGEQMDVIFDQVKEVGYHNVSWNARDLASGVYIYTIDAKSIDGLKNFNSVKKMMLVK